LPVVGIHRSLRGAQRWAYRSPRSRVVINWMPRQLDGDWTRWVSVSRVLRAARRLTPELKAPPSHKLRRGTCFRNGPG
jgi:hypothetical protein